MDQRFNLFFNNNKEKPVRPQTPGYYQQQYRAKPNKSFNNIHQFSPSQYPMPAYNHHQKGLAKSRASVASSNSHLQYLVDQPQYFPQDLVFLLKNEEKNINQFKQKIQRQKIRVQNDFAIFKTEQQHILQDLKISVQAQLDQIYKTFITKYAQVKGQVQQLRIMRKEILANNIPNNRVGISQAKSNKGLISQIEKDTQDFRNYRIYGYLTQVIKQKLAPILQISNQIILLGSVDCPFYKTKEMQNKLRQVKTIYNRSIMQVYGNLNDYIVSPKAIIQKQKYQQPQNSLILKNIQNQQYHPQQVFYPPSVNVQYGTPQPTLQMKKTKFQTYPNIQKKSKLSTISKTQTSGVIRWGQTIGLKKIQRIVTDHQDSILCIFFIGNNYIATGSKDKTINIYSLQGHKITTLRGHDASICSLTSIKNLTGKTLLASGSDFGCCCLILWNLDSWTIASRIQSHTAAVTCILDLQDGEHLLTGSYDKKINLFNHNRGQLVFSTNNSKSALASMIMSADKRKLVTSGLDKRLTIWNIYRNNHIVQSIQVDKVINNNSVICSLQASLLCPQLIFASTYDGKIKSYNILNGQLEKVYTVNQNNIIQLVVLQRQMKNDSPLILSCSPKDRNLTLTKMDSGISQTVKVSGSFHIEFGCGIGPKIVLSHNRGGIMAILNQSKQTRQFCLYEIQVK